jgi:hypothetical protein
MLAVVSVTTERGGLSRRLGRSLFDQAAPGMRWALAGLLLAVSGLFGGLDTVPDPQPAAVAAGTPVSGGPWRVEVTEVRVTGDLPPLRLKDQKNRWVYVICTVTVTTHETWFLPYSILGLSGVDGLLTAQPHQMVLYRDMRAAKLLHPNMPEKVAFFWEQSGDAPLPTTATVLVKERVFRQDSLGGEWEWKDDGGIAGRVTLPVVDKRVTPPASPSPSARPAS